MQYGTLTAVDTGDDLIHAAGFIVYAPGQFPDVLTAYCGVFGEACIYAADEYDIDAPDFCPNCIPRVKAAIEAKAIILDTLNGETMHDHIRNILKGDKWCAPLLLNVIPAHGPTL